MGPINLEDATANAVNLNLPDGNCSDLGVPAPYGRNIAPMSVYLRRGGLIGDGQKRVARAKPLTGDVGGVPNNKVPPSPGQEKGARSKTTQGEGMRSTRPRI